MGLDWPQIIGPDRPILETVVRGSLTYLGIIALLRGVLKRQAGSFGLGDMLFVVLLADASQNAMAGAYESWASGMVLAATLIGWNYTLDLAAARSRLVRKILQPDSTVLVRDGRLLRANLEREGITVDELCAGLRTEGVDDYRKVREARIESQGQLSVIPMDEPDDAPAPDGADPLEDFLRAAGRLADALARERAGPDGSRDVDARAREALARLAAAAVGDDPKGPAPPG